MQMIGEAAAAESAFFLSIKRVKTAWGTAPFFAPCAALWFIFSPCRDTGKRKEFYGVPICYSGYRQPDAVRPSGLNLVP